MVGGTKRLLSKTSSAYIAVGVVLLTVMTLIGISAFLRVVEIDVDGTTMHTYEEIIEASGLSQGDSMMYMNTQNVSRNILQSLPFVKDAQVTRNLPDRVLIEVTESVAIASVAFAGETLILDASGRVLKRLDGNPGGLIEIRGLSISDAKEGEQLRPETGAEINLQNMQDILAAIEREGMEGDISYLDVSNITNIHFGYLNLYRVILGGVRDLRHKLGELRPTVEQIEVVRPNTPGDINMSDPSGEYKFSPHH